MLLLTTLTPRQIVMQKFASRMTPILSFVFLSFPLLAITYTFGGVTVDELALGILLLGLYVPGAGRVRHSVFGLFSHHVEALVATYLCCPIFALGLPGDPAALPAGGASREHSVNLTVAAPRVDRVCTFFIVACLSFAESILVSRAFVPYRSHLLGFLPLARSPLRRDERVDRRNRAGARPGHLAEAQTRPLAGDAEEIAGHVSIPVSSPRGARGSGPFRHPVDSLGRHVGLQRRHDVVPAGLGLDCLPACWWPFMRPASSRKSVRARR